jgi:hypothetical protein
MPKISGLTQADRLEEALMENPMTNWEMATKLRILNYTGRISDLRKKGLLINSVHLGDNCWKYTLIMKAPWTDYNGQPIFEGNTIAHPEGITGVVIYNNDGYGVFGKWRVDYGCGHFSGLNLQIGEKGMAVVVDREGKPEPKDELKSMEGQDFCSDAVDVTAGSIHRPQKEMEKILYRGGLFPKEFGGNNEE